MVTEYVTVSSSFILGRESSILNPKLDPHAETAAAAVSSLQASASAGMGDMWPVLMSAWFNIRTDHCLASLTCWLTSWGTERWGVKSAETTLQRYFTLRHRFGRRWRGGVTQECETTQGCVSCAFHCGEASSVWYYPCVLVYMSCCLQVALNPVSELKVQMGPWSVLGLLFEALLVSFRSAFIKLFWLWKQNKCHRSRVSGVTTIRR